MTLWKYGITLSFYGFLYKGIEMAVNPKNVQQAVKVAVALANPTVPDKDWALLKERFHLEDNMLLAMQNLVNACKGDDDMKTLLRCLTF